jgi:hypothetical protein
MTDEEIKEMIEGASKINYGYVTKTGFINILNKSNV